MKTLNEFAIWAIGKKLDYDFWYGAQCVDLVQFYNRDVIGGTFLSGTSAKDIWNTYPTNFYIRVANSPTGIPPEGAIVIWGTEYGSDGHIAIRVGNADTKTFSALSQNDPIGRETHIKTYTYAGVLGWLVPRGTFVIPTTPTTDRRPYWFDRMNSVTFMQPRETLTDEIIEKFVAEYPSQLLRSGLWDKLCKKAGIEGDTNSVTVTALYNAIATPLNDTITSQGRVIETKSQELQEKTDELLKLRDELKQTSDTLAKKTEEVEQKELLRQKWYTEFMAMSKLYQEAKTELTNATIACTQKINALKTLDKIPLRDIFDEIVRRIKKGVNF